MMIGNDINHLGATELEADFGKKKRTSVLYEIVAFTLTLLALLAFIFVLSAALLK